MMEIVREHLRWGLFSGGGANSPGLVTATSTTGCLTFEWVSNASANTTGWVADVSCFEPCQDITASIDSTTPALNGTIVEADVDETITFNGSGTFSVSGAGATYLWDFGDGNTDTGQTVSHSYNPAGIYTVTLTITDTNGCTNTVTETITAQIGASSPGNPFVDAGDDFEIDCMNACADITADFLDIGETNTYNITQIPFVPPFPFQGLSNSVNTNIDDAWSGVENLPFDFCYFSDIETLFQVGSNGVIRFDVDGTDGSNGWAFSENLPNNTNPTLGEANVFTPGHDIDPSAGNNTEEIAWEIIGTAPNRVLAVSFFQVPMFSGSCNNLLASHMVVFYETTNVIDIYIQNKPICSSWNSGNAVVGIQNDAGNLAFVPPGRNTSDSPWTTTDEAWRFTPAGPSVVDFAWLDDTGAIIGTTPTINVCPQGGGETYTARAIYTNCNGDVVEVTDDITVTTTSPFTVDLGPDLDFCEGDPDVVLDADINSTTATYQWTLNGTDIPGETNPTLTVSSPDSGTYGVTVTDDACSITDDIVITFHAVPVVNPVTDYLLCDDSTLDGFTAFELGTKYGEILGGQTGVTVTFHETQADADAGTNPLSDVSYTNIVNPQTIYVRIENDNNTDCYVTTTFDLFVTSGITPTQPSDLEVCDDLSNDGTEVFDLSVQTLIVLGALDPLDYDVTYHETQADAEGDINEITPDNAYNNTSSPQTIYIRIEDVLNTACFEVVTFDLIVNPLPGVIAVTPLEACDDDTDGFTQFTLEDKNAEVLNGQTGITVSYHETQADADNDVNPLVSPYTNIVVNTQTVYIRLENDTTGCYNTTTMDLIVNPIPVPVSPPPLEVCDDDNDGFSQFDLTVMDTVVLGGQTGMSVTYHETQADADNDVNALVSPYSNIVPDIQTVYVRLEDDTTGCYDTVTLDLIVNPVPEFIAISDYELCDYNNPGDEIEQFDLTTKDIEIINGQNASISYHETLADAQANINPIVGLYSNTSNPQVIYVRLEDNNTGCASVGTFNLVVNPLPTLILPTPLEVCDDNIPDGFTEIDLTIKDDEIRGGNPNYAITYYLTQADADAAVNQLPIPYTNISNPQTIYARGQDINTGCYSTVALDLVVEQAPTAFTPTPLEYCDPDSDGFGVFTLEDAELEITGGAPGLTVTYHETLADAQNNVNALTSPYNNIVVDTQTIWVRVESSTIATDCATIVELVLIVNPDPQIDLDLEPLQECDDNTDGFTQFDLTQTATEVLNGIDPALVDISWYETQANADAATNPILVPTSYTNISNPQTLWVRVEYIATGCYKITSFELIVNELPVLTQPSPLEMCDYNNPGDEMEAFTLEDSIAEILNGQTGISITFYETQADADAGTSPITSPYVNTSNPQTIYARAENDVTGCVSTITLDLRVNPIPTPATPTPLEECDTDNDGFASFDLESRTIEIINGELDISITYHETMADAESGTNALVSPYDNIVPNQQTVYARAENNLTGCYTIVELELIVLPSPEVPLDIEDYVLCDDDNNGITQFDLTVMDTVILGSQLPADFILTYHLTQADADTGANPIVNVTNYTNASNPQTIYVRLESVANGCVSTGQFDLVVALPPVPVQPTPLEECDDEIADEITVFDLTQKDAEITGGNGSWAVTYYETQADADNDTNAIDPADAYTNTSVGGNPANPQTLYVRVTDTDTGCLCLYHPDHQSIAQPDPEYRSVGSGTL